MNMTDLILFTLTKYFQQWSHLQWLVQVNRCSAKIGVFLFQVLQWLNLQKWSSSRTAETFLQLTE